MPRQSRLDFPGTLHPVICRGIEKRDIFSDDKDRDNFIERMGIIAEIIVTSIYAWALMKNHPHIMLQSGLSGLFYCMRSLAAEGITGTDIYFKQILVNSILR